MWKLSTNQRSLVGYQCESCRQKLHCDKVMKLFESLWVEIHSDIHHNLICGIIYSHSNNDLETFMSSLNKCLDKINKENKYCIIMGDFNINLLNEFLDNLTSFNFSPPILQPTRINHHSATLIDNIFFNSTEHQTISGNIDIVYDLTDHLPKKLLFFSISVCSS